MFWLTYTLVLLTVVAVAQDGTVVVSSPPAVTNTTVNAVEIIRRVLPLQLNYEEGLSPEDEERFRMTASQCAFAGEITLGHPMSIDYTDRFFQKSLFMMISLSMTVDHINTHRCGVSVRGQNYSLSLRTIGDSSSPLLTRVTAKTIVDEVDYFLGP